MSTRGVSFNFAAWRRRWVAVWGVVATAACTADLSAAPTSWEVVASATMDLKTTPLFVAADRSGQIYYTTFNPQATPAEVGLYRVTGAGTPRTTVVLLAKRTVPAQRGFGGVAVDEDGNVYATVDFGGSTPSQVMKLLPTGEPDTRFGHNGVIERQDRLLGVTVANGQVVVAVGWGRLLTLDARTGSELGITPAMPESSAPMIRDVSFHGKSGTVFGIDRGNVYAWTRTDPAQASTFRSRLVVRGNGRQNAGQGIFVDPITEDVYFCVGVGGYLGILYGGDSNRVELLERLHKQCPDDAQMVDTAISPDRRYLVVTDQKNRIFIFRRPSGAPPAPMETPTLDKAISAPTNSAPPSLGLKSDQADAPSSDAPDLSYYNSLEKAQAMARLKKGAVVIFFTGSESPNAAKVESEIFKAPGFAARFPKLHWFRSDTDEDQALMLRSKVFKIPTVVFMSPDGLELGRIEGLFDVKKFEDVYRRLAL